MTATAPTTASTWTIDSSHSTAEFAVKHMVVATVKGRFAAVAGTIVLDEADPTRSSVTAEIDTAGIQTHDEKRDEHLRSADFLDTTAHPKITFRSTRVEPKGNGEYAVSGDLTLHGVTRPVVLTATYEGQAKDPWGNTKAGFSATTKINRKEFGLAWNVALEAGGVLVGDDVKIGLEIEALKQ